MRWIKFLGSAILAVNVGLAYGGEDIEGAEAVRSQAPGRHNIFVFLDGTGNNAGTETNVYKLYREVRALGDPSVSAVYLPGVGSALDPSALNMVTESGLGKNQQQRIVSGYRFVSSEYRPEDRVYLFGFSRGAIEARALAGWLSYAGVPKLNDEQRVALRVTASGAYEMGNRILQKVQYVRDDEYADAWRNWTLTSPPVMANFLQRKISGLELQSVPVAFVGVWDTVPGSTFKNYGRCKEEIGFVKKYLWWMPGVDRGERYKLLAYPPITAIAHAVSRDEKRDTFKPVLVCDDAASVPPRKHGEVLQMAFPGAHSDVGGGYPEHPEFDKKGALPNHSFNWVVDALEAQYAPATQIATRKADALALAHWSIGDAPGNTRAHCEEKRPWIEGVPEHDAVKRRLTAAEAPIRFYVGTQNGADVIKEEKRPYPDDCSVGKTPG